MGMGVGGCMGGSQQGNHNPTPGHLFLVAQMDGWDRSGRDRWMDGGRGRKREGQIWREGGREGRREGKMEEGEDGWMDGEWMNGA